MRCAVIVAFGLLFLMSLPAQAGRSLQPDQSVRDFADLDLAALLEMPSANPVRDFEELDLRQLLSGKSSDPLHDFESLDLMHLLRKVRAYEPQDFTELDLEDVMSATAR